MSSVDFHSNETLRRFATASYLAGSLDEAFLAGRPKPYDAWTARADSIAVASADGFHVDVVEFMRASVEDVATNIEKGVRSALDALRARRLVSTWTIPPSAEMILEVHAVATKATARRLDATAELRMQDLAAGIADMMAQASEAADLREASTIVCSPLMEDAFGTNGQRMRFLLAPWLAARVLGMRRASVPMAAVLAKASGGDGRFPGEWPAVFAGAMEASVRSALDGARNMRLLAEALCAECKVESKGSSVIEAVDFFIGHPVAAANDVEKVLDLTRRGANLVINRMVEAGVLESAYPERTKNRMFLCRRALVSLYAAES